MKILFLGHCSVNLVGPIAQGLRKHLDNVTIDVVNLERPGGTLSPEDYQLFDRNVVLPVFNAAHYPLRVKAGSFLRMIKHKKHRDVLLLGLVKLQFGRLYRQFREYVFQNLRRGEMQRFLAEYDVLHFHFLSPYYTEPLAFLHDRQKALLTFWGSDLFTFSGVDVYAEQLKALEKATLVSVSTLEMREVMLSKFGRHLAGKVRYAHFGIDEAKLQAISRCRETGAADAFRSKFGIPPQKRVVAIGYSANREQQHLDILHCINQLPAALLSQIHVVLPMTYGNEGTYAREVIAAASRMGFPVTAITEYMSTDEVAALTASTQIMLNLRPTDAFNNALMENLFAGNMVVVGAWLPYGSLRRMGVHYEEIEELAALRGVLPRLIEAGPPEKCKYAANRAIIERNLSTTHTIKGWLGIYRELNEEEGQ